MKDCAKVDSRGSPLTQGIEPLSVLCLALCIYIYICFYLKIIFFKQAGMTLLVLCLTEKPGAILMQVRVPGVARDFSPRVNFQCIPVIVSMQPSCAMACMKICVHVKNPKHWQPYYCLDTRKYLTH